MKNIFVGNISFKSSASDLQSLFEEYGSVDRATIITDRETDRSRGFGFVEMPDDDAALKAIESLNGKDLGGRELRVNEARPREERR